jgi:hypothetical protein
MSRIAFIAVLWILIVAFVIRWRKKRIAAAFLPTPAPSASRAAKVTETIVLAVVAVFILAMCATSRSTGGNMLTLDELQPDYAKAYVAMFCCAAIGVVIALLLAMLQKTTIPGSVVLAFVLIAYSIVLNGGRAPGSWFLPESMFKRTVDITIIPSGCNVVGAELWVNGVLLGKTPCTLSLDEFEARVPYWSKPPADYETDKVEIPGYHPNGTSASIQQHWIKLEVPTVNRLFFNDGWGNAISNVDRKRRIYYAKVRYAGQWACGGCSGSGGTGGLWKSHLEISFYVLFPERQKRIDVLIRKARLADYRVGDDWFQAMETYRGDGWLALVKAAKRDARLNEVLDAWATWRYGLDRATDAESVWRIFENICDEADARRQYATPSPAGHAVELLAPKLSESRLIDRAVVLIRGGLNLDDLKWDNDGRLRFGYTERPEGMYLGGAGVFALSSNPVGGGNAGGYPVMHALWLLNSRLRKTVLSEPNVIQERIVPELIRQSKNRQLNGLFAAAYFGGPIIDKHLLRQKWRLPAELSPWEETCCASGGRFNRWILLLAMLNDDAGREFRRRHAQEIMNLIDIIGAMQQPGLWPEKNDFLFADPWLAKIYWPRYVQQVVRGRSDSCREPLEAQWQYLSRMGDAAAVEMFVGAWNDTNVELGDFWQSVKVLDQLQPPLRRGVIDAIVQDVRKNPPHLAGVLKHISMNDAISYLREHDPQYQSEILFAKLQKPSWDQKTTRQNVRLWLAHTEPDSPLVETLVHCDKPELRLLAIDALREYPIPKNRKLLEKLCSDSDPKMHAAAERALRQLKRLAAQKPADYASDAASAPSEPSDDSASL